MPKSSFTFEALGTYWEIVTGKLLSDKTKQSISRYIEDFDQTYSRFRDDSLVIKISQSKGTYVFPKTAAKLFDFYEQLYEGTDHHVTPLIGSTLEALGYDRSYNFAKKVASKVVPDYFTVVKRQGTKIVTTEPVLLDFGAAGKGYLVDLLGELLNAESHNSFTIDASGDILHQGDESELIGLENPFSLDEVIGEVKLKNKALCASATNRRAWGKGLHHIVDPLTAMPVEDIVATWVIADSAMEADGLATALFFSDPQQLKTRYNYEYVRLHATGEVEYSQYFTDSLYKP